MSVSIFSYRGEVTAGVMVDAAMIPDPAHVVAQLERELQALAHLAPARPDGRPPVFAEPRGESPRARST